MRECASLPAFLTLRLCLYAEQRQKERDGGRRGKEGEGEKAGAEQGMIALGPFWQSGGVVS